MLSFLTGGKKSVPSDLKEALKQYATLTTDSQKENYAKNIKERGVVWNDIVTVIGTIKKTGFWAIYFTDMNSIQLGDPILLDPLYKIYHDPPFMLINFYTWMTTYKEKRDFYWKGKEDKQGPTKDGKNNFDIVLDKLKEELVKIKAVSETDEWYCEIHKFFMNPEYKDIFRLPLDPNQEVRMVFEYLSIYLLDKKAYCMSSKAIAAHKARKGPKLKF